MHDIDFVARGLHCTGAFLFRHPVAWNYCEKTGRVTFNVAHDTYIVCILEVVADEIGFDWDQANAGHIAAHGISPEEVAEVFSNDEIGIDYDVVGGEERWTVVGETDGGRVLVVVYTMRDDLVRPVTAYEASNRLRAHYYLGKKG